LKQETFPSPVQSVSIVSDKGTSTVPVDAAGRFKLVLLQGHEYRFLLSDGATASEPIVARGSLTRLDTTVRVKSGGAAVDLGSITYWGTTSRSMHSIVAAPSISTTLASMVCEEEDDDDDGDNHECADGIDPNGAACDGGPAANQDDGAENDIAVEATDVKSGEPMALPQYNLPAEIGCADEEDDGEEADD
jgi:hypothetical protein